MVNQVIRAYVEQNPTITFSELQKIFSRKLQGSMGVFDTFENEQAIHDRIGHKRYYLKADELIKLSDVVIATSNQWGIGNIGNFFLHPNKLGLKINGNFR